ncbi:MAG: glycosyl transferase [Duncaniella sp.]|nr:glycosyl transferase [Duncaniella sp.]MDE6171265.1 glycosyl transferase [Duncaniella sp.]MDE6358307.1 glycosyl transferase [Duncaniella sp.]
MTPTIPKTIHYCWFGSSPLPPEARRCVASWQRYFPDYEIKEWNNSNYDVRAIPFTRQAADMGKWAFVSDYARFEIIYRLGGLYFDTDVEVIAPMNDIIEKGAFMGIEKSRQGCGVNAGLGLGAPSGHPIYREILDSYKSRDFIDSNGNKLPGTVVGVVTDILKRHGFIDEDTIQEISGITIYPNDYFNPLDDYTGLIHTTPNSRSIHHYAKTWCDNYGPLRKWAARLYHRILSLTD